MGNIQDITPPKLRTPPDHYQPRLRVDAVKAYVNGETQVAVAARFDVSSVWVGTSFRKLRRSFAYFLKQNYLEPPFDAEFSLKQMSEPTRQKFLWYLDRFLHLKGYEYCEDFHIPITLKSIDVPIFETPLSPDIKRALKHNGFTNMNEITKLSLIQIRNLPKINTTMLGKLTRYFIMFQPDKDYYSYAGI